MSNLAAFASLPLAELTAELEWVFANHHAPRRNYADRMFSTAACSGQVTPSPADTAVRGELIEVNV
jgi:hypothetical protein